MNIFFLDRDTKLAAQYHCDKHVVKMILESAQLLSTAHRVLDGDAGQVLQDWREPLLYKATHKNHPCAVWTRKSLGNYNWLYSLFQELCIEYTNRFNKIHLCESKLMDALCFPPDNIPKLEFTDPPQAMDQYPQCKVADTVQAYRNYYIVVKSAIAEWKYSEKPYWFNL